METDTSGDVGMEAVAYDQIAYERTSRDVEAYIERDASMGCIADALLGAEPALSIIKFPLQMALHLDSLSKMDEGTIGMYKVESKLYRKDARFEGHMAPIPYAHVIVV